MEWVDIVIRTGSIGVLAWVVNRFLMHLEKRDGILADISSECHKHQARCAAAMDANTEAMHEVSKALMRCQALQEGGLRSPTSPSTQRRPGT